MRFLRRVASAARRLWRLCTSGETAYRLKLAGSARTIERVVDHQIRGDSLVLTDCDGTLYIVALSEVRYLLPRGQLRSVTPVRVCG